MDVPSGFKPYQYAKVNGAIKLFPILKGRNDQELAPSMHGVWAPVHRTGDGVPVVEFCEIAPEFKSVIMHRVHRTYATDYMRAMLGENYAEKLEELKQLFAAGCIDVPVACCGVITNKNYPTQRDDPKRSRASRYEFD